MFEMRPVFAVSMFENGRRELSEPPRMAIVEAVLRVVDGDGYFCRLAAVPWLPWRVFEAFVRLEGVSIPEGGEPDYNDQLRAETVKTFASQRILGAKLVMLHDIRRDEFGRVLADVHADGHGLTALLAAVVRETAAWEIEKQKSRETRGQIK